MIINSRDSRKLSVCFLVTLFCSSGALAQDRNYYDFHPVSIMSLGIGFSPNDLSSPKVRAINYQVQQAENGALSTSFSTVLVRNATQLKQALHLDLSVDASYLLFRGGTHFAFDQNSIFNADSLTMVISANTEYGRLTMKDPVLTPQAQSLIDSGKMDEFEQTYGSRVVIMERRGASVSVILTISDVSQEAVSRITAGVEASGGWGPLSGSAKMNFQTELEQASKEGRVNIQVVATGGEGFSGLGDLLKVLSAKTEALKNIQSALGDYLKQFKFDNSAPVGFHTASMRNFGWKPEHEDLWTENKDRNLLKIAERYREIKSKLGRINFLLSGDSPVYSLLTAEKVKELRQAIPLYEDYLDKLAALHRACKSDKSASGSGCSIAEAALPREDLIPEIGKEVFGARIDFISLELFNDLGFHDWRNGPANFQVWASAEAVRPQGTENTPIKGNVSTVSGGYARLHESGPGSVDWYPMDNKTIIVDINPGDIKVGVGIQVALEVGLPGGGGLYTTTTASFVVNLDKTEDGSGDQERKSPTLAGYWPAQDESGFKRTERFKGVVHYKVRYLSRLILKG